MVKNQATSHPLALCYLLFTRHITLYLIVRDAVFIVHNLGIFEPKQTGSTECVEVNKNTEKQKRKGSRNQAVILVSLSFFSYYYRTKNTPPPLFSPALSAPSPVYVCVHVCVQMAPTLLRNAIILCHFSEQLKRLLR